MIVREFLTKLGFESDEKKVKSFDKSVKNLVIGLTAAVGAATAASAAALKLAMDAAAYGDEVAKTARQIGTTSEALQELRFAFDRLGVSEAEVTTSLDRLSRSLGRAGAGGKTEAEAFDKLGVSIRDANGEIRSIEDLMPDLADGFAGITSEAERAAIAQDILGRSGGKLAMALAEGGAEVEDLREQFRLLGGGLSNRQAAAAEAFTDAMTNMRAVMSGLKLQIGAQLMPVFQPMIEAFTEFLVINRELIMQRIERAFEILIGVMRSLGRAIRTVWRVVDRIAQAMGGWESTIEKLGTAFTALTAILAARWLLAVASAAAKMMAAFTIGGFLRIAMIAGRIAVLALALEDLYEWWAGGESYFGDLIQWLQDLGLSKDAATGIAGLALALGLLSLTSGGLSALVLVFGSLSSALNVLAGSLAAFAAGSKAAAGLATLKALGALVGGAALTAILTVTPTRLGDGTLSDEVQGNLDDLSLEELHRLQESEQASPTMPTRREPSAEQKRRIDGIGSHLENFQKYLNQMSFEPFDGPSAAMPDIDNSKVTTLNMEVHQSIAVPAGSTSEQIAFIKRTVETSMSREINRAATALEA